MPYKTLTCETCGSEFEGWHNAKYCSDECRVEAHKVTRACENCGDLYEGRKDRDTKYCSMRCYHKGSRRRVHRECEFDGCSEQIEVRPCDDQRYCSTECRDEARQNRVECECEYCGEVFEVPASDGDRRYCSQYCYWDDSTGPETEKRTCPNCSDQFEVKANQVTQYCSKECSAEDKMVRMTKTCEECGEEFDVPPSLDYRVYCSVECFGDSLRLVPDNYDHFRSKVYAQGEDVEAQVSEMMGDQDANCAYCGDSISDDFHLDHKRPVARDGRHTVENCHLTCPSCNHQKNAKTHAEYIAWRLGNDLYIHHLAFR